MKKIFVINGRGGSGKDTICDIISKYYKTINVSSIDPIKEVARELGWKGDKEFRSRKFLSDLKRSSAEYNDYPFHYVERWINFFLSDCCYSEILFLHIREPEEIQKIINKYAEVKTLLITKSDLSENYGNYSDDNVGNYIYDYTFENNKTLEELENNFLTFFKNIIEED